MWRYLGSTGLFLALFLVLAGTPARADIIEFSVSGLPAAYLPGSTFSFEVEMTGATGLNAYTVGLDLNSTKGTAGTDFYFLGSPDTQQPANDYIFQPGPSVSPQGFWAQASVGPAPNTAVLSLTDNLDTGQSVLDVSPNTLLARVVVKTTPQAGNLTLSFDQGLLDLEDASYKPLSGTVHTNLPAYIPPPAAVPEPATLIRLFALLLAGTAVFGLRRWRQRAEHENGTSMILTH